VRLEVTGGVPFRHGILTIMEVCRHEPWDVSIVSFSRKAKRM
jgi:hypothetical protein